MTVAGKNDAPQDANALEALARVKRAAKTKDTALSLAGLGLTALPPALGTLTELRELDLSGNALEELPPWIGALSHLEALDLSGNRLTHLPEALAGLTALQRLGLGGNQFVDVPHWLGRLPLTDLGLADNPHLLIPPPETVAAGTAAVLVYLRTDTPAEPAAAPMPVPILEPPADLWEAAPPTTRPGRRVAALGGAVALLGASALVVAIDDRGSASAGHAAGAGTTSRLAVTPTDGGPGVPPPSGADPNTALEAAQQGPSSDPADSSSPGFPSSPSAPGNPTTAPGTTTSPYPPRHAVPTTTAAPQSAQSPAAQPTTTTRPPAPPNRVTGRIVGFDGLCLDDRGAITDDYNPVQVFTCNGTDAQNWTIVHSTSTIQIFGKCLDVYAAGTANGTTVDLYTCNGTGAQVWVPRGDGSLFNPESGKCLDDTDWSTTPGKQAQIWDCAGTANQQWQIP